MNLAIQRAAYARKLLEAVRSVTDTLARIEGVERVSLFGSYARGRRDLATDLDVLVVWDTDKPFVDRLKWLYQAVEIAVDLDLICYTPAEFQALRDQSFLRHITRDEVVLYEKKSA